MPSNERTTEREANIDSETRLAALDLADRLPPGSIVCITVATDNGDGTVQIGGAAAGGTRAQHMQMLRVHHKIIQTEADLAAQGLMADNRTER